MSDSYRISSHIPVSAMLFLQVFLQIVFCSQAFAQVDSRVKTIGQVPARADSGSVTSSVVASPGPVINLKSAVEEGLSNSALIRKANEKVQQSRYQKYGLRATLLPKLDLTTSAATKKDSVANREVGSVVFDGKAYNSYNFGLRAEQSLFTYGTRAGLDQLDLEIKTAMLEMDILKRDHTKQIITAFYKTLVSDQVVKILQEQEKVIAEILATAQRRLSVGGKRIDVLQVKTQQALLKPKIQKAQKDLVVATAELVKLMGTESVGNIRLQGGLPVVSMKQLEKELNLKEFDLPELTKIRFQREKNVDEKAVALGKHLPNLKLVGDYGFTNYTRADLMASESNSWQVQLLLTIPIFSGFSGVFERRALVAAGAQLEWDERNTAAELALKQITSRKALEAAEISLASAEEAVSLAKESLAEAKKEYRFGMLDFLQFLQVESADFEATTSLMQLRSDMINAYADYFAASGQSLDRLVELLMKAEGK